MANEIEYELPFTGQEIEERLVKAGDAVLFTKQTLTDEQKAQARENIGAAAVGEGGSGGGVFYVDVGVNVTTEDITEITTIGESNKTLAEVSAAYSSGQNIVLRVNWLGVPVLMPMVFLEESLAFFTAFVGSVTDGMPDSVYSAVMADDSSVLINAREITVGGVTDEHINSLIDAKLGVIENGTY